MFLRSALTPDLTGTTSDLVNPSQWLIDILGGNKTSSGESVNEITAMMNSNVYSVLSILAGDIAKLPINLFKDTKDGPVLDESHPAHALLSLKPNPLMTAYNWKEVSAVNFGAWGNAYSWIEFGADGYPSAIWPLDPGRTQLYVDPTTGAVYYTTQFIGGRYVKLMPYEVLHFRYISRNGLLGLSPISAAREEIGMQQAATKYIGSFYQSGTTTRGILKVPSDLNDTAKAAVRSEWRMINGGLANANEVAILKPGWEFQNLTMPLQDAQFIETRKFGILEIAKLYKMPPHKLGQLDRATFSNIEQQSLDYVKTTLLPILTNWEQEIKVKLFTDKEQRKYTPRFNVDEELRGDSVSRGQYVKSMIEAGVFTINDGLRHEKKPTIGEAGDKHYMSLNYTTIDQIEELQMLKAKHGPTKGGENNNGGA